MLRAVGRLTEIAAGEYLQFNAFNAEHTAFRIGIANTTTYLGRNDEVFYVGYNVGGVSETEPAFGLVQENDYAVTVRGVAAQRTTEHYLQCAATINDTASRPWFWSFDVGNNVINYGYLLTGPNQYETSGGGGLTISSGTDNNSGAIVAFDSEGGKFLKPLIVGGGQIKAYTGVTNNGTTDFTLTGLATGHGYRPGANLQVWKSNTSGYETVGSPYTVTSVTSTSVTLSGDNSSNTVAASPGTWGVRVPVPSDGTATVASLGVGKAILSGNTHALDVAGAARVVGTVYFTDATASNIGFGAGTTLNISKLVTNFQLAAFSNTSGAYAMGFLSGNTSTFGIGPTQNTDSNFNSANSLLTINAGAGVGVGGTIAQGAKLRVAGGTSSVMPLWINNQTDGSDAPTPSAGGVLYVVAGALKYRGSSGTITTLGNA